MNTEIGCPIIRVAALSNLCFIFKRKLLSIFAPLFDCLRPSQQSFSEARINVSCSRTQRSDACEAGTSGPSVLLPLRTFAQNTSSSTQLVDDLMTKWYREA